MMMFVIQYILEICVDADDDNRVQLCKGSGANTSDYINASYIQVSRVSGDVGVPL